MTPDQLNEIKQQIAESIEMNLAGTLGELKNSFDKHQKDFAHHVEVDALQDQKVNDFINKATPAVDMATNIEGFGKIAWYVIGFLVAIATIVVSVVKLLKK